MIALDQVYEAPDGRTLRVVSVEDRRIGLRNLATNRLSYMPRWKFHVTQKWHLTLIPASSPQGEAAKP